MALENCAAQGSTDRRRPNHSRDIVTPPSASDYTRCTIGRAASVVKDFVVKFGGRDLRGRLYAVSGTLRLAGSVRLADRAGAGADTLSDGRGVRATGPERTGDSADPTG